jgi:hypothetical protein
MLHSWVTHMMCSMICLNNYFDYRSNIFKILIHLIELNRISGNGKARVDA